MLSDGAAAEQISIHAPAKGATKKETGLMRVDQFQSTLPRRERPADNKFNSMPCQFQSTLPRRERHIHDVRISIACLDFNPRSREGSDFVISLSASSMINFNPRSREGSDFGKILVVKIHQPFQSTLPRRERPCCQQRRPFLSAGFQSTLPRRERPRRAALACGS